MEILNNIDQNLALTILSLIIGLGGIVLAAVFYSKSKIRKTPFLYFDHYNVISEGIKKGIEEIKVSYKDHEIKTLTVTKVAFWNGGNRTIMKSEIPESESLTITPNKGINFYESIIVKQTANDFKIMLKPFGHGFQIDFDYLEPNEGIVIQLLHSGMASKDLCIAGKVIGGARLREVTDIDETYQDQVRSNPIIQFMLPISGSFIVNPLPIKVISVIIGLLIAIKLSAELESIWIKIPTIVVGTLFVISGIIMFFVNSVPNKIKRLVKVN